MGILDLFKPGGSTVKEAAKGIFGGVGDLAVDLRESITGEGHKLSMGELEQKARELENAITLGLQKISALEVQGNVFQRSWRPGLAWVIIFVIAIQYLVHPVLAWIEPDIATPALKAAELWPIIMALIGYRSYEKTQGLTG